MKNKIAATSPSLEAEIDHRLKRLRSAMSARRVDTLIITGRDNFEYFTGFHSLFWTSPARPFFAVVRVDGGRPTVLAAPIEANNARDHTGRCEFVFYEGFVDGAIEELGKNIRSIHPAAQQIAIDYGEELAGRGSLRLIRMLDEISKPELQEASDIIWSVRAIKSEYEIDQKRIITKIATDSFFGALPDLRLGQSEKDFSRILGARLLRRGADRIDWLPVHFHQGFLANTRPPSERQLAQDDFIWIDMGCVRNGVMSDINRVAKVGEPTSAQEREYERIRALTIAIAEFIRPGMTGDDVAREAERLTEIPGRRGAGRVGHGSGMALTEPPSLAFGSTSVIETGMILHIEPRSDKENGVFQLEEVVVVRENSVEFLSDLAPPRLPLVLAT